MTTYYARRLSAERLKRCYDLAPERVRQYLDAELRHVIRCIVPAKSVLELGCGYGRILKELSLPARRVVGIDNSLASLVLAREFTRSTGRCDLAVMDATALAFADGAFDAVVCIQNGICAFRCDPLQLFRQALRVTRPGGTMLVSTYSPAFWPDRLRWFELQAEEGLVGEIDYQETRPGQIVCRDGFQSCTFSRNDFENICRALGVESEIVEIDGSSLFCRVTRGAAG